MEKHIIYIGMGSNVSSAVRILLWARRKLRASFGSMVHFSKPVLTDPIDYPYPDKFLNQVGAIVTDRPMVVVESLLKSFEVHMRTTRPSTEGQVVLDLDLLWVDGTVMRPNDWERPYIQEGVAELHKWVTLADSVTN